MYISSVSIDNVRSIAEMDWIPYHQGEGGWHVIIGDNGSGKSSILKAISLALIGYYEAPALRQDWSKWLKEGASDGVVRLHIKRNSDFDFFAENTKQDIQRRSILEKDSSLLVTLKFKRNGSGVMISPDSSRWRPEQYVWRDNPGWFSASFGPFRRFTGGDKEYEEMFASQPRVAPHLTVFGENVALTECLKWLQDLKFKEFEGDPEGNILYSLRTFIDQKDFLPHQTRLEDVSSRG